MPRQHPTPPIGPDLPGPAAPPPPCGLPSSGRRRALMRAALPLCALAMPPAVRAKTPGEEAIGETLRDATLQGLNGPPRKLSQYRGKPLVINVWASWCGPCRSEMASLERLAWLEPVGQFTLIGISTDDYPDRARAFMRQSNATINHFIDQQLLMENMLGATALPLTVLVDARHRVLEKIYGAKAWDSPQALALLARVFGNPKIASLR